MKKIFFFIAIICFGLISKAQYPLSNVIGNDSSLTRVGVTYNGGIRGNFINHNFNDTTAANLTRIAYYNGAQIYTTSDSSLWWRYNGAWIRMSAAGFGPGGYSWNVGGNLFPVTQNPAFKLGTTSTYGGSLGLTTNGIIRLILDNSGIKTQTGTTVGLGYDPSDNNTLTQFAGGSGTAWSLLGNSGTTAGTNFLGTTDGQDVVIKSNSAEVSRFNTSGYVGISQTSPTSKLDILTTSIGTTQSDANGVLLENNTPATSGAKQQMSPAIVWKGLAWKNTGSLSQTHLWRADVLPVNSTVTQSISSWQLSTSQNGGSYYNILKLNSGGPSSNAGLSIFQYNSTNFGQINSVFMGATAPGIYFGQTYPAASTGIVNTSFGLNNLQNLTSGSYNTAIGYSSSLLDTSGPLNTSVGYQSLNQNLSGQANVAVGANALLNSLGDKNTAVGAGSMENTTSGYENTFVGEDAGLRLTTGIENVGLGWLAGSQDTVGNYNTSIGTSSGRSVGLGSQNVFLGNSAGYGGSQANNVTNSIAIGYQSYTTASNQIALGNSSITQNIFYGALMPNNAAGISGNFLQSAGANTSPIWTSTVAATSVPLSGITAATTSPSSPDNADYKIQWNWQSLSGGAFGIHASSTAAVGNGQQLFYATLDGVNSNSNQTTYAGVFTNQHSGTGSTNVGISVTASTGSNNYAIVVPSGGGSVGIGTSTPSALLHVINTTEQLRVGYDASNYYKTTVGSTGGVTFDAVGSGSLFTFSDNVIITTAGTASGSVATIDGTQTLTNKRWTARVGSTTSSATPTINTDNVDIYKLTAQNATITSFTSNLSGTPVDGDFLEIQITGTGAIGITWGSSFVATTVALPTTTVSTTTLTVIFQFYTTSSYGNSKWHCVNSF